MYLSERETEMLNRVVKMFIGDEEKHFEELLEPGKAPEDRHIYLDLYSLSQALEEHYSEKENFIS
jgi:hypothetical protein